MTHFPRTSEPDRHVTAAWKLWTANYSGNIHTAAATINQKQLELVPYLLTLYSPDGLTSIAVFRVPGLMYDKLYAARLHPQPEPNVENLVVAGGADGLSFSLDAGAQGRK